MVLGKSGGGGEEKPSPPGGDMKMRAAEDALEAFKSGDASALNDALSRHYRACASEGSSDGEGAYEEDDESESGLTA